MLKIALTHDVDRVKKSYQYLSYFLKYFFNKEFKQALYHLNSFFYDEPYWNFDKIIKIEEFYNVKSTFFFMNEEISFQLFKPNNWKLSLGRYKLSEHRIVAMIKYLDVNKWEIGLHGSYNSYKDKNLLRKEKNLLENILGHNVIGIRQHYLNLNSDTWAIQKSLGFKYDSTFGFNNKIGFKENKFTPFTPFDDDFIVFPLIVMDSCFVATKTKWEEYLKLVDIAEEKGSILVINWHQRDFNEKEFPEHSKYYRLIIEEGIKRNAAFRTLSEYYYDFAKEKIHIQKDCI